MAQQVGVVNYLLQFALPSSFIPVLSKNDADEKHYEPLVTLVSNHFLKGA